MYVFDNKRSIQRVIRATRYVERSLKDIRRQYRSKRGAAVRSLQAIDNHGQLWERETWGIDTGSAAGESDYLRIPWNNSQAPTFITESEYTTDYATPAETGAASPEDPSDKRNIYCYVKISDINAAVWHVPLR